LPRWQLYSSHNHTSTLFTLSVNYIPSQRNE
jgi:hypothetical protein